jgi:hypothetical protein
MLKKFAFFLAAATMLMNTACAQIDWKKTKKEANKMLEDYTSGNTRPTNDEVVKGLREALKVGANNGASLASKLDGFNANPKIRIPFPQDAIKVKNTLENLGMKSQVDKFETTLNRAAEEAAKEAAPIFVNAIMAMTVSDGFKILQGRNNEATEYLKSKTTADLTAKFKPVVEKAIQKVEVTKYWNPLITKYNAIPGVEKKNPDLNAYVTERALQGLFKLVEDEELKIRQNPGARVSDILKKVFGWNDSQKK